MRHLATNNFTTTLAEPVSIDEDLSIKIADGSGLRVPCWVSIGDEVLDVESRRRAGAVTGDESNGLYWIAYQDGAAGNALSVELVDPETPESQLAVSVDGQAITVSLETDQYGEIVTTAIDIFLIINRHQEARQLVILMPLGGGVVEATDGPIMFQGGDNETLELNEDGARGRQGTAASAHSAGSAVKVFHTAGHVDEIARAVSFKQFLPCNFSAGLGDPTLDDMQIGSDGPMVPAWKFEPATKQRIALAVLMPSLGGVESINITLVWYSKSSETGNVVWRSRLRFAGPFLGGLANQESEVTTLVCPAVDGADVEYMAQIQPFSPKIIGYFPTLLLLELERDGTDADDTFDADAYLLSCSVSGAD